MERLRENKRFFRSLSCETTVPVIVLLLRRVVAVNECQQCLCIHERMALLCSLNSCNFYDEKMKCLLSRYKARCAYCCQPIRRIYLAHVIKPENAHDIASYSFTHDTRRAFPVEQYNMLLILWQPHGFLRRCALRV